MLVQQGGGVFSDVLWYVASWEHMLDADEAVQQGN